MEEVKMDKKKAKEVKSVDYITCQTLNTLINECMTYIQTAYSYGCKMYY